MIPVKTYRDFSAAALLRIDAPFSERKLSRLTRISKSATRAALYMDDKI